MVVSGSIDESNLSGDTIVDVNFLETDLSIQATNHIAMVDSQQEDLKKIFRGIDDIISLDAFQPINLIRPCQMQKRSGKTQ